MTHRGPFQPLPFCDSVILDVSCFAAQSPEGAAAIAVVETG